MLLQRRVSGLLPYLVRGDSSFVDRSSGMSSEHEKQNVRGRAEQSCDRDSSGMEVVVYLEQKCDELMVSVSRAQRNPYTARGGV